MKPTVSSSKHALQSFPLTDYSFQTTAEAPTRSAAPVIHETKSPAFHSLSSAFFAGETRLDYAAELTLFILISGIAAWPVMSMLACLNWMKMVA
ncbi:MAG: hypothetical protein ABJB69_07170 [Spartobacteria bacterium]